MMDWGGIVLAIGVTAVPTASIYWASGDIGASIPVALLFASFIISDYNVLLSLLCIAITYIITWLFGFNVTYLLLFSLLLFPGFIKNKALRKVAFGLAFLGVAMPSILSDDGPIGLGLLISTWLIPALFVGGIILCVIGLWDFLKTGGKGVQYTEADYARAKEEMDQLYFREHGVMPDEGTGERDDKQ